MPRSELCAFTIPSYRDLEFREIRIGTIPGSVSRSRELTNLLRALIESADFDKGAGAARLILRRRDNAGGNVVSAVMKFQRSLRGPFDAHASPK